jgi:serine/threonine protein kinase
LWHTFAHIMSVPASSTASAGERTKLPSPALAPDLIGLTVNNYEIRALIGEGGMGAVYMATHPFIDRRAAIKVLHESYLDDERIVRLFLNEARATNTIRHPNIIDIMDVGRLPGGRPYLMMEYLEGESLCDRLIRDRVVSLEKSLDIIGQVAAGLSFAHAQGVVHQDLKPDNLFLIPDDDLPHGERVKILDFGIAKLARPDDAPSSLVLGSPFYMAPEQCRGRDVDRRADVYATGALLYHMLCGAPPFVDRALAVVLLMHLEESPRPPRQHNPEIPASVEAAILRALAKEPSQRFSSMGEFLAALVPGQSGARRSARPLATVLATAALIATSAIVWHPGRRPPAPEVKAAAAPSLVPRREEPVMCEAPTLPLRRVKPRPVSHPLTSDDETWGRRH